MDRGYSSFRWRVFPWLVLLAVAGLGVAMAATVTPVVIEQPGTQPQQVTNLESPDKCDNCHGGYNPAVEPAHLWRGGMMANAGRDPIFWATLAMAEQDFDGAGDLCIRCHSTAGWLAGRATPTDGSGLAAGDSDGVECDYCHKLTRPDDSEYAGVQVPPFTANDSGDPGSDPANVQAYFGSGMGSIWGGNDKLGPYANADARHQFMQSVFHRSVDFCGTCHDVSNAAVGNLAHNHGTQPTADPVTADGSLGGAVDTKAAFNNLPYEYGIVERTFSEYKSGLLPKTLVSDYPNLPPEMQAGALKAAYESALVAGTGGNFEDGTPRYFSCQTCHMRPVNGVGCNKQGVMVRKDLALHDQTGGNYWMPVAIQYLDARGELRLGGGLTAEQIAALNDGIPRAKKQLNEAAALTVTGDTVRITNLTGHKLISGYPEGRRMWLHVTWYDALGGVVREDGAYGPLFDPGGNPVMVTNPATGQQVQVESLADLHPANTKVYEAHYGLTQQWAAQLLSLGYPAGLALSYDRYTGAPDFTLGDLAALPAGSTHESFHFVVNNAVAQDDRIPPYGMSYDEARKRNALPVPADQYGGAPGGTYRNYDDVTLVPPGPSAVYATIDLMYQPTSWEYIQFLWLANAGQNAFLANEGLYLLDGWLNAGDATVRMAKPYVMASTVWGTAPVPPEIPMSTQSLSTWSVDRSGTFSAPATAFVVRDSVGVRALVADDSGAPLSGAQVFLEIRDAGGATVLSMQAFSDASGTADTVWKTGRREATGTYTLVVTDIIKSGFVFDPQTGQIETTFTLQ